MIKTFRGIIEDGGQDKIRLSTKKGKIGYKIIKFDLFPHRPGGTSHVESVMQIFKVDQTANLTTANSIVDFADGNLLAAAYLTDDVNNASGPLQVVMFEQEVFNQDVFITHTDEGGSAKCNYYLELEAMTLSDNAAAVSTLRDIRLNPQVGA
jgi:hypothetical protein